jgi:hypothetical protein
MLPPRSSAGLGETGGDAGGRVSVSEVKDIAADINAATTWAKWVVTVQRWQPSLHLLRVQIIAFVHQRPMGESSSTIWSYKYNLSEMMTIVDELCATMASGLRLLSALEDRRWLREIDGNNAVAAAAAGQSIDLLATVIRAFQESLEEQLKSIQASDAPTAGQQLHAGKPEHRLQLCF